MKDPRETLERLLGPSAVGSLDLPSEGNAVPLASPATEAAAAEVVRCASSERWRVLPVGLGSKLSWRAPGSPPDLALSTRALSGIVGYEPGDGTLTARAGSTMASIADAARAQGHHLIPRVPHPDGSTLGGALASGQSGADRLRHGPARHHVLGMRVLLADASSAKSGGRLVKNVTGYDMHRLYCGSQGTLCVILEASMRLAAAPESEIVVTTKSPDRATALAAASTMLRLDLQPLAVRVENVLEAGTWRAHGILGGRPAFVDWARRRALESLPGARTEVEPVERILDLDLAGGSWPRVRAAGLPSRLAAAVVQIDESSPAILDPGIASAELIDASDEVARMLSQRGLEVTVRGRAPAAEPRPGDAIERRLRLAFDPHGVFATGSS